MIGVQTKFRLLIAFNIESTIQKKGRIKTKPIKYALKGVRER